MSRPVAAGAVAYTRPVTWSSNHAAARALIVVLRSTDNALDVALATFEVEDANERWLMLLPNESGVGDPLCVLLDTRTSLNPALVEEVLATMPTAGFELVRGALASGPPPDRVGDPLDSAAFDELRAEADAEHRALRAALERASDEMRDAAGASAPSRPAITLRVMRTTLGLARASASTAGEQRSVMAEYSAGRLRLEGSDRRLVITAESLNPRPLLVAFDLSGVGRLLIALSDVSTDVRTGRLLLSERRVSSLPDELEVTGVRWVEALDELDEADLAAVPLSRKLALGDAARRLGTLTNHPGD